jgi:type VI protein secretion system component VasF
MSTAKSYNPYQLPYAQPLVQGGQGHDDEQLQNGNEVFVWVIGACLVFTTVIFLAGYLIGRFA